MVRRLALLLLCFGTATYADVHVFVEPSLIDELDTFELRVRASDADASDAPDLTPLEADFEVLSSQVASQRNLINGNLQAWVDFRYTLRPKRSGELRIPPLRVGNQRSEPTTVLVRALDPGVKQTIEQMVFFETEVTANPVYVQAQTVFIRRLFYASGVQLYSDLPGVPEVADAVIVSLGETQSRVVVRQGTRYGVIEQRFAIFPENSGTLSIPESSITSSIRVRRDGRTRRSGIRIVAPAQTLTVLPIPPEYPADATWLPATNISLQEAWLPDRLTFDLGDPIKRTISVLVEGNTGSSIPPLPITFPDHFKSYPETPSIDDDVDGNQVVGHREESISLVPVSPGMAALPAVSLTWWDTQARRVRVSRLEARTMTLSGATPAPVTLPADRSAEAASPAADPTRGRSQTPAIPLGTIAGAVALLALCFWLARQLARRRPPATDTLTRKGALADLKSACDRGDLPGARRHLLDLLSLLYDEPRTRALIRFTSEPRHAALWSDLNEALYAPAGQQPHSPTLARDIWRAARSLKPARTLRRLHTSDKHADALPALYGPAGPT